MNDKNLKRDKLKTKRANFQGSLREQADAKILDNFLCAYGNLKSFFIYNSFSSEADTKSIIESLIKADKRVYLPRVDGGEMYAVPYGKTEKGAFGIDEPSGQPFGGDTDITVIPLLAVNGRGYRIGYGKGYYDKYLKDKRTKKVGLGYNFQIEEFKEDEWDIPLDAFVCEEGIINFSKKAEK